MANIKSAKKRIAVNQRKNDQNRARKSEIATEVKKFKAAVAAGEFDAAEKLLREITALVDVAAGDSTIHKNKASRNKASLSKMLSDARGAK